LNVLNASSRAARKPLAKKTLAKKTLGSTTGYQNSAFYWEYIVQRYSAGPYPVVAFLNRMKQKGF